MARDIFGILLEHNADQVECEDNANLLHLLCNSIRPEGAAILAVQVKGIFNSLRHFYAKLVDPFEIVGSLFGN